jgi:hypothetical protein
MGFPTWRRRFSSILSSVERVWTRAVLGATLATTGLAGSSGAQPPSSAARITPYSAKFVLAQAQQQDDKDKDKDKKAKKDKDKDKKDPNSTHQNHSSHASHSSHSSHSSHRSHSSHSSAGWA